MEGKSRGGEDNTFVLLLHLIFNSLLLLLLRYIRWNHNR